MSEQLGLERDSYLVGIQFTYKSQGKTPIHVQRKCIWYDFYIKVILKTMWIGATTVVYNIPNFIL